ncbi:MMPL domain-containing protein [Virgibacillus profundi]|uniref:MMPL domain-containing protein n=1 Tax=Virgibacillus profundi TaxID=2024555 RepID=A0A2A2IH77_9BACI|nr:MMPL family transporter [Virgibacillus profundi]PAV30453.1 MMPL domain-containing protein [Virgibacillus profundi]PXY54625.1 MMPL family transporter [Virgibacillus profundi]
MKNLLHFITDRVTSKKGMWITVSIWLVAIMLLMVFAPSSNDYKVSSLDSLPEDAQSVIAQNKVDKYFKDNDGIPAILVFQTDENELELTDVSNIVSSISEEDVKGIESIVPLSELPPQATESFFSEDGTTAIVPLNFDPSYETSDIQDSLEQIYNIVEQTDLSLYVTGPAGIASDTNDLFSRADLVLILSTVGIILVLLIILYRSPALALIPLLAAGFVYGVVNQLLGLVGKSGVLLSSQSLSIMSILLFAAVIDYSLFVFSRYREELKTHENKHDAMKIAMRGVGVPVFFSGATVLAAMLVLFFAQYEDSRNFAPIFGTTMVVVILASVTLVPALFTIFGRKSFWPIIPRVGDQHIKSSSFWSKVGRFVTGKPIISIAIIGIFLLISATNVLNTSYEFDNLKSFPDDMPSRVGYEILEKKFEAGDLAPTTVLFESEEVISEEKRNELMNDLSDREHVSNVRMDGITEDEKVISYSMTFDLSPYSNETMNALEEIIDDSEQIAENSNPSGELYFAGETATAIDDRSVNNRDLAVVITIETLLIFVMLIFLTKSFRMPVYMMGTILVSYVAALGLGMFLTNLFFDIENISNRVPMYAFVFLVALGIDYNIILISRFMEERTKHPVKKAVEIAVANTGGVISSAGLILAATFAVLMTQPIEFLFVFGFIVAVGILLDTFLIRGVLLPGLLVLFEKDTAGKTEENK